MLCKLLYLCKGKRGSFCLHFKSVSARVTHDRPIVHHILVPSKKLTPNQKKRLYWKCRNPKSYANEHFWVLTIGQKQHREMMSLLVRDPRASDF